MIIRCRPKCTLRDGNTSGSLDLETDEVVCDYCGEGLPNISPFTKQSMKAQGLVIRKEKKKAFVFDCATCKTKVEAEYKDGFVVGKGCKKECDIRIPRVMVHALKVASEDAEKRGDNEEESESA